MSEVKAVYVSLNASWSRQCRSLVEKRDSQGVFAWVGVSMIRVERRRVWRDMVDDLESMCGWAMWSVGQFWRWMEFREKEERERKSKICSYMYE